MHTYIITAMRNFLVIIIILSTIGLMAQTPADTSWKFGGDLSIMASEASFSNWAAGGENSVSSSQFVNLNATYEKNKVQWGNNLALGYGILKTGDRDFRKSEDKIDFTSKVGVKWSEKWFYSAMFNFKSQFVEGYHYVNDSTRIKISDLLAPGYFLLGVGIDFVPNKDFSFYVSPATARLVVVTDTNLAVKYGLDPGKTTKPELGGLARFIFKKEIIKNVDFQTKLELFSNYLQDPQNIDVNWDNIFNMKINKFLSTNFTTQLLYDHDIIITEKNGSSGPRTQFKHVLSIGFSYKF